MKKVLASLFFVFSFAFIFSLGVKPTEAACQFVGISNNGNLVGADDEITFSSLNDIPTLTGRIEVSSECYTENEFPLNIRAYLNEELPSEIFSVKTAFTDIYVNLGGQGNGDSAPCIQNKTIDENNTTAEWTCTVNIRYVSTVGGNDASGTGSRFNERVVTLKTNNKGSETLFNSQYSSITFNSASINTSGECKLDDTLVKTFDGTTETSSFTLDSSGNLPSTAFGRISFTATTGCIGKTILAKSTVFKLTSSSGTGGGTVLNQQTEIQHGKITVNQVFSLLDFAPLFFDSNWCVNKNQDKPDGSKVFECTMDATVYSNETSIFASNGRSTTYQVIIPGNLDPETLKLNPKVISTNLGNGIQVTQFGSRTIQDGFAWDPCYDPKTEKMITYRDLANPQQVAIDKLSQEEVSKGINECYTLLSGLPLKLSGGDDTVSSQIGYLEARDKNGKVLPGIFKTVIVGKFYIGDFVLYLFRLFMGIFGLLAVGALIYVGIAIASNKENSVKLKNLRAWLWRILVGIAIVLGSYIILSIIDPNLTEINFGINKFNLSEQDFPDIVFNTSLDPVTGKPQSITFKNAYVIAKRAELATGIPAAYIMATLQQESALGNNVGKCNNPTPHWKTIMGSSSAGLADQAAYVRVMGKLGRSTENQPLSCPSGGGRGGAMGPLQFIPSTWESVSGSVSSALGGTYPDPWNMEHAIFAAAFLYKKNGATANLASLKDAACKYYSGSKCEPGRQPPNEFYGNAVVKKAIQAAADIELLLKEEAQKTNN